MNELILAELVSRLEKEEGDLVQHLRTSGLCRDRELFLTDEMFRLRRTRKQTLAYLNKVIQSMEVEKKALVARVDSLISDLTSSQHLLSQRVSAVQTEMSARFDDELRCRDERIKAMGIKYATTLRQLETKIADLQEAKKSSEDKLWNTKVASLHCEIRSSLVGEFESKLDKYTSVVWTFCL